MMMRSICSEAHAVRVVDIAHRAARSRVRDGQATSLSVRPASLRAGFFLLLVQEKETREKDPPGVPVDRRPACRLRKRAAGFAEGASLRLRRTRRILRRPFGLTLRPLAVTQGDPEERCALLRAPRERGVSISTVVKSVVWEKLA